MTAPSCRSDIQSTEITSRRQKNATRRKLDPREFVHTHPWHLPLQRTAGGSKGPRAHKDSSLSRAQHPRQEFVGDLEHILLTFLFASWVDSLENFQMLRRLRFGFLPQVCGVPKVFQRVLPNPRASPTQISVSRPPCTTAS